MKNNLKTLRTEHAIRMAFIEVCQTKGFSKMTIKDIIKAAAIIRGTFYLHYLDKFDMLEQYQKHFLNDISKIFEKYPKPPVLTHQAQVSDRQNAFYQLFKYLYEQRHLAIILLQISNSDITVQIKQVIANEIKSNLPSSTSVNHLKAIPTDYAREIMLQDILVIISFWLKKHHPEKPEVVFDIFIKSRQLSPVDLQKIAY